MTSVLNEDIAVVLRQIIAKLTENPLLEQQLEKDHYIQNAGMDSLRIIQLVIQIEQHYNVTFEDYELSVKNFETIDEIAHKIIEKLGTAL
jgi:acyl carrier protein